MKCPLCGYEGEECGNACNGCPLAKNCGKKHCPNCGCEILPESSLSKLVKKVRKIWLKRKEEK